MHGSDAHRPDRVGVVHNGRYCWIKGDLAFESLRQTCLEPETRVFIGLAPPRGALPSQSSAALKLRGPPWLATPSIPLNPGVAGTVGASGSGKTALADIIAAGGYALASRLSERSFIRRAKDHLGEASARLTWEDGDPTANELRHVEIEDFFDSPRFSISRRSSSTACAPPKVSLTSSLPRSSA